MSITQVRSETANETAISRRADITCRRKLHRLLRKLLSTPPSFERCIYPADRLSNSACYRHPPENEAI